MIPRISLALLVVVLAIISTVSAFLTPGMGLVRLKAVKSITRPFLSTSDESNLQQDDEFKRLKDEIAEHKRDLLTVVDSGERTAIRNQIAANTNLLGILSTLKSQQGNLPHIFAVFFSNRLINILFAQSLSTPQLLPFRVGNDAK